MNIDFALLLSLHQLDAGRLNLNRNSIQVYWAGKLESYYHALNAIVIAIYNLDNILKDLFEDR